MKTSAKPLCLGSYQQTCLQNGTVNWTEVECLDTLPNPEWRIKDSHCLPQCHPGPTKEPCYGDHDCHQSQLCVGGSCQAKSCDKPLLSQGIEVSAEGNSFPIGTIISAKCKAGYRPTNKDSTQQDLICMQDQSSYSKKGKFVTLNGSPVLLCIEGELPRFLHKSEE